MVCSMSVVEFDGDSLVTMISLDTVFMHVTVFSTPYYWLPVDSRARMPPAIPTDRT